MSWYSLLGIVVAAWVAVSVALALTLGLFASRRRRLLRRPLAPVVSLEFLAHANLERSRRAVG